MVKTYEELAGAVGRAQRFRRERHDASALFAGEPPVLYFDDRPFDLKNLSGSGAGASVRNLADDEPLADVHRIGVLRLVQLGDELFRGPARFARASLSPGRAFAGFALDNDQFDLDELRRLNARSIARRRSEPVARTEVPTEYRAHCADVIAFVGDHVARIERQLGPIEKNFGQEEREAIFRELMTSVEADWRRLLLAGNEFALEVHRDKARFAAIKRYTEAAVTPTLVGGASWNRCYYKPMGYPGDFRIMNYMYDRRPEGASLRETFLHGLGLIAGRPIETRMRVLSSIVANHFSRRPLDEPRRTASIGCGPARELEHIVSASDPRATLHATLIDQEIAALEFAENYARTRFDERRLRISAYNTTFKEMFNPSGIAALRDQDIIYSLGLVDYFSPLLARRFVSRAYDLVRPGGKVIIGNASNSPNGTLWTMEHVLDWTLYFRDRAEMSALAGEAEGAVVRVDSDPLDSIYFLIVEKPL